MNDDFLSQYRQAPRPEFARSLYARLAREAKAGPLNGRHAVAKRIGFGLAALCLVFAIVMAVSPAARAAVDRIVATITVGRTTVYVNSGPMVVPTGVYESYDVIWSPVSPGNISANYPFFAHLPAWVPAHFKLQDRAALYYASMDKPVPVSALFEWKDNRGGTIQLMVEKNNCPDPLSEADCSYQGFMSVGLDSEPQVIAVNAQPGILIGGTTGLADLSDPVRTWNPSRWKLVSKGLTMIWDNEGRTFRIFAASKTVTKAQLLRFAESIP
jgi:hypothetical protein